MVINALVETITRMGYARCAVVCPLPRPTAYLFAIDFQRARASVPAPVQSTYDAGHDVVAAPPIADDASCLDAVGTLADASATAAFGIEAVNALSTAVTLLDRRCRVLYANASADRLLKMHTIFKTTFPVALVLRDAESNDALRKATAEARRDASAALLLRDDAGRPVVSAVALPLRLQRSAAWPMPPVLLAMNELMRPRAIPDRWLFQLFGLTPAESSVANWLVSGRTIYQYAQHRGISLETARSQVKAVLSKTGMSRQTELVAALARLPIEHAAT